MSVQIASFIAAAAGAITLAVPAAARDYCELRAERTGSIEVAGAKRIVMRTGAGDLEVAGEDGAQRIQASGVACASTQELLDAAQLRVRREGETAFVETAIPVEKLKSLEDAYVYIDVKVRVPSGLPVEAHDSSGDAELEQLDSLVMHDSSGDLDVRRVKGAVRVQDSSGDIRISEAGSITLEDSSGDVMLERVRSGVEIVSDSSGDLIIDDVGGTVHVRRDSSGDIRVSEVRGSVLVGVDSSGSIYARNVTGDFTVEADGSGGIRYDNVKGRISTPE